MPSLDDDLAKLALQEERLVFGRFDADTAWSLIEYLKARAEAEGAAIAIDVTLVSMPLAYLALPGTTPDNADWIRRKRNSVFKLFKSSYAIGRRLEQQQTSLEEKLALPPRDYVSHGGCVPIRVKGAGFIGALTVSGLPQRQDHNWAVAAMAKVLGLDITDIALSAE
ncbi:heme-degrading domain-containing protein [Lacibacterium aquatile]|uniref:UPF0303 protein ACFSM5_20010 n=1 Tax=Lacibacterium aquatile TaxID=1168082 RepID=A0ABW5DVP4_9PROT